jgi:hypothetical protein
VRGSGSVAVGVAVAVADGGQNELRMSVIGAVLSEL